MKVGTRHLFSYLCWPLILAIEVIGLRQDSIKTPMIYFQIRNKLVLQRTSRERDQKFYEER